MISEGDTISINNVARNIKTGNNLLRFKCTNCGNCCKRCKVRLSPYDIKRLCENLGLKTDAFYEKYALLTIDHKKKVPVYLLKTYPECIFLKNRCRVHKDRPFDCRTYPVGVIYQGKDLFYYTTHKKDASSRCPGLENDTEQTIDEWMKNNEAGKYLDFRMYWDRIRLNSPSAEFLKKFVKLCYHFDDPEVERFARKNNMENKPFKEKIVFFVNNIRRF